MEMVVDLWVFHISFLAPQLVWWWVTFATKAEIDKAPKIPVPAAKWISPNKVHLGWEGAGLVSSWEWIQCCGMLWIWNPRCFHFCSSTIWLFSVCYSWTKARHRTWRASGGHGWVAWPRWVVKNRKGKLPHVHTKKIESNSNEHDVHAYLKLLPKR